jgi:hypothetical protein
VAGGGVPVGGGAVALEVGPGEPVIFGARNRNLSGSSFKASSAARMYWRQIGPA